MTAAHETEKAQPIEDKLARRGYQPKRHARDLLGPCHIDGGDDRFDDTPQKAVWHCRKSSKARSVIDLLRHVEKSSVRDAVEALAGEATGATSGSPRRRRPRTRAKASTAGTGGAREGGRHYLYVANMERGTCMWETPALTNMASRHNQRLLPTDRDAVLRDHKARPFGHGKRLPWLLTWQRQSETEAPQAVHRTALTPDGRKQPQDVRGPKAGAAIKFWPD